MSQVTSGGAHTTGPIHRINKPCPSIGSKPNSSITGYFFSARPDRRRRPQVDHISIILFSLLFACSSPFAGEDGAQSRSVTSQDAVLADIVASERRFNSVVEDGWKILDNADKTDRMRIVDDWDQTTDSRSGPRTLEITYPEGLGSEAPHNRSWKTIAEHEFRGISIAYWVKYSANWTGHPSLVNKMFYVNQTGYAASPLVIIARGAGQDPLSLEVRTQDSRFGSRNLPANQGRSAELKRGRWHRVEVYAAFNNADRSNGRVTFFLDGQLIGDYGDVQLSTADDPKTWGEVKLDAIWGGNGPASVPATQTLRLDDLIVKGHR
jgi:hypothetical protein